MRSAFLLLAALAAPPAPAPPHYASLRSDKVYLREGPTYQHRVLFIYKRRDYPLQVLAAYDSWRRVRDADGTIGWVSQTMISDARTVLGHGQGQSAAALVALRHGTAGGAGRARRCRQAQGVQASVLRDHRRRRDRLDRQKQDHGEWTRVRSSTEPGAELGPPDGDPVETAAAQAGGVAQWLNARDGVSAIGGTTASRLGQVSWAMFEWARNPYVLVIMIYLFAPFYAKTVVGDGVCGASVPHDACGQSLAGWIQAGSGILIAMLAPFLGAIADAGGRRKPWIALYVVLLSLMMALMWYAKPHSTGWPLFFVSAVFAFATVCYEFSAVFHNSLLPTLTTQKGIAGLSGLGLALGDAAGIVLLLFMLFAFALPGAMPWPFLASHPLFGLNHAAYEPERIAGAVCAIWLIAFSSLLFAFTPDRPASNLPLPAAMREGVRSVVRTVKSLRHYRNVGAYLLARLFFNDGMTAVLTFSGIYAATTFTGARSSFSSTASRSVFSP